MFTLRKSSDRGATSLEWLDARHSFSFGRYIDRAHTGFMHLVVLNEDRVAPEGGFAPHRHENMEIVTYLVDGSLTHEDSTGNLQTLKRGDLQRMSAGTGIAHSEMNHSSEEVHLLQLWFHPLHHGAKPEYETTSVLKEGASGVLLRVGPAHAGAPLMIHQRVWIYAGVLPGNSEWSLSMVEVPSLDTSSSRGVWVQSIRGGLTLSAVSESSSMESQVLEAGDGASIVGLDTLGVVAAEEAEFLVIVMEDTDGVG